VSAFIYLSECFHISVSSETFDTKGFAEMPTLTNQAINAAKLLFRRTLANTTKIMNLIFWPLLSNPYS